MPSVDYIPFKSDELDELCTWVQAYFEHDGLEFNASVVSGIKQLIQHPEYGIALKIVNETQVVGYSVMTFSFDYEVGGRIGVITDLFLVDSCRGKGIGTSTLKHWEAFAKETGLCSVELFVLNHNAKARQLYERFGFKSPSDRLFLSRPI